MKIELRGLIFVCSLMATLVLLQIEAVAQCGTGWEASGYIEFFQRGQEYPIRLTLEQKGSVVQGRATHTFQKGNFSEHTQTGLVDGTVTGDRFSIQIFWPPHPVSGARLIGVYNSKILPSGRLDGDAYEKSSPQVIHTWYSGGTLKCKPRPSPPVPSPSPKPLKSSGKPKPPTSNKSSNSTPPTTPMKVPGIVASRAVFQQITDNVGFVFLSWDGGPDHPYAEVWFKVNGAPPVRLLEQGKGTYQMRVDRYKQYEFVLTDAGKNLASVVVLAN